MVGAVAVAVTSATASSTGCCTAGFGSRPWPTATGLELTPPRATAAATGRDHDWVYAAVLVQLRDVIVPRIVGPARRRRAARASHGIVKYLEPGRHVWCRLRDPTSSTTSRRCSAPTGPIAWPEGRAAAAAGVAAARWARRLPAHLVAPDRPRDRAGAAVHGGAGRPALARAELMRNDRRCSRSTSTTAAAERTYRDVRPRADDDFHDEEMTDRWWETETNWFSWNVPERESRQGGRTARPGRTPASATAGPGCGTTARSWSWELPYRAEYSGLQLPPRPERDMRDFEWPNGVHVRMLEPLQRYAIDYDGSGAELELRADVRGDHGAQPASDRRRPVRQGHALRPGRAT